MRVCPANERCSQWNILHPDKILHIRQFFQSGEKVFHSYPENVSVRTVFRSFLRCRRLRLDLFYCGGILAEGFIILLEFSEDFGLVGRIFLQNLFYRILYIGFGRCRYFHFVRIIRCVRQGILESPVRGKERRDRVLRKFFL